MLRRLLLTELLALSFLFASHCESSLIASELQLQFSIPAYGRNGPPLSKQFTYAPTGSRIIYITMVSDCFIGVPDTIEIGSAEHGRYINAVTFPYTSPAAYLSPEILAVDLSGSIAAVVNRKKNNCMVIDLPGKELRHELKLHADEMAHITAVNFSPKSPLLAVGTNGDSGGSLYLWDTDHAELVGTVPKGVEGLSFHPEGKFLVFYDASGLYRLRIDQTLSPQPLKAAGPAAFSLDGNRLATRSPLDDREILIWNTTSWEIVQSIRDAGKWTTLALSPNAKLLATGGDTVRVWDLATERLSRVLTDLESVTHVAFSPNGTQLAAADGESIKVWSDTKLPDELRFVLRTTNGNPYIPPPLPIATSAYPTDRWGDYSATSAFDGDMTTAWVEAADGSGIGERIAFFIPEGTGSISVLPGYGNKNVFSVNNRVRQARLIIHEVAYRNTGLGGFSLELCRLVKSKLLEFEDVMKLQESDLGIVLKTRSPENRFLGILEIVSLYPGKDPDTSISEIRFHQKMPEPRWTINMGSPAIAEPVISDGILYIVSEDGLHAVDANAGKALWSFSARNIEISPPWVEAGRVYLALPNEAIYVLDASSGEKIKTVRFERSWKAAPIVVHGMLYALDKESSLYAVDLKSGQLLWENPEIYDYAKINDFLSTDGVLFIMGWMAEGYGGGISALDMKEGLVLWQKKKHPSVAGDAEGTCFCDTTTEAAAASMGFLYCSDIRTGEKRWDDGWMGDAEKPAMGGNLVAVNGRTYDVGDGIKRWSFSNGLSSDLFADGGVIFFTDDDGILVAASENTGQERWTYHIGGAMDYAVVAEETLFLTSGKRCFAIDLKQ
jgi:outer membrane protein assembly factor BamB